jgi:hypothetical protein
MKKDPVKKNMDKLHKPKTHRDKTKYDRKSESEKLQDDLEPIQGYLLKHDKETTYPNHPNPLHPSSNLRNHTN